MSNRYFEDMYNNMYTAERMMKIIKEIERLNSVVCLLENENIDLKTKLVKADDSVKLIRSDKDMALAELEKLKNRFSGLNLEGKYVKCLTAMYAISNSVSEQSSKEIADGLLRELGEK